MLFETRKSYSDFWMMVIHHVLTITLILVVYTRADFNYCVSVAHLHDLSDIFLEFSKTINYLGYTKISNFTFLAFAIVFIVTRLFIFPVFHIAPFWTGKMDNVILKMKPNAILTEVYSKFDRFFIPTFLSVLCFLSVIWSIFILKMVWDLFTKGSTSDIREKEAKKADKQ